MFVSDNKLNSLLQSYTAERQQLLFRCVSLNITNIEEYFK